MMELDFAVQTKLLDITVSSPFVIHSYSIKPYDILYVLYQFMSRNIVSFSKNIDYIQVTFETNDIKSAQHQLLIMGYLLRRLSLTKAEINT